VPLVEDEWTLEKHSSEIASQFTFQKIKVDGDDERKTLLYWVLRKVGGGETRNRIPIIL